MKNLNVSFIMTSVFTFQILSIVLVFTSFMVIYSQHPIFSLLFLISSFFISSILLFILECEFLALLFIIIYVGAIAILFLFAVMMLDMKFVNLSKNQMKYLPMGFIFGFMFLSPLIYEILDFYENTTNNFFLYSNSFINWYDLVDCNTDVEIYGQVLYSYFVLQFLIAGLILLLVLVGVVYLTNNFNINQMKDQSTFKQLSRNSKIF